MLYERWLQCGALRDIDEAVTVTRQVVEAAPSHRPDRGGALSALVDYLLARYGRMGAPPTSTRPPGAPAGSSKSPRTTAG
ncbi:hypothetical protein [Streptomyces chryseus]